MTGLKSTGFALVVLVTVLATGLGVGLDLALTGTPRPGVSSTPAPSKGGIAGWLLRVGGAAPGSPVGVRGTVSATNVATGANFQASTTSTGVFTFSVPVGTYRLSGRSPLINGGKWAGKAKALVHVRAGQTSHANVYFQVK